MIVESTKRTLLLSIDKEQIRKEIYAESACIALLSSADGRPPVITDDNRALVYVYIEKAFVELVSSLAAFVDAAGGGQHLPGAGRCGSPDGGKYAFRRVARLLLRKPEGYCGDAV